MTVSASEHRQETENTVIDPTGPYTSRIIKLAETGLGWEDIHIQLAADGKYLRRSDVRRLVLSLGKRTTASLQGQPERGRNAAG